MSTEPGSSKTKGSSPDHPHKKQKVDDEVKLEVKSTVTIESLPDEMMIEIFGHLTFKERLLAQKVCKRWFHLVRTDRFWKRVKLLDISASGFIRILASLPSCTLQLHFECRSDSLPFSLPEVMAKIHNQCPCLNSLILRNIHLLKNLHNVSTYCTRRSKLFNTLLLQDAECKLGSKDIQLIESEFHKEDHIELQDAVLSELKILSFRGVLFSKYHLLSHFTASILPKIVVLDLSYSKPLSSKEIKSDLFSTLIHLEELYLPGWKIADVCIVNFLLKVKKLRVLDLEHSRITNSTISVLKMNGNYLEELHLAYCNIYDICRTCYEHAFFPHLRKLCLKNTHVTVMGIEKLLTDCPSIQCIDVSRCKLFIAEEYFHLSKKFRNKMIVDNLRPFYCDHFKETKHWY